ncbi:thioredoxin family protein, partial [Lacihabitans sp. LS3-19]|uniref:thioredoxin family protein n=1 Tax=Lacihabitans sp. LS3-19 TaxID=2487335 RepID=UPI0020CE9FDE
MNKKHFVLILIFFSIKLIAAPSPVFLQSIEEVKQKAIDEHKGIFVLYYADWCGFCKKFQEETLTDPQVINVLNSGFVSYRVLNSSEEGTAYKAAFFIKSLPTLLFFDENGDIKTMSSGFKEKEEFIQLLKNVYKSYFLKPYPEINQSLQFLKSRLIFNNYIIKKDIPFVYSKSVVCDDGNPCTTDSEGPLGCVFTPKTNGSTCDDNNICTENDQCIAGTCSGTSISCPDDGNLCTTAACNPLSGCIQVNNNSACDDGDPCTINDVCHNGVCAGIPKTCDDGNPCTTDSCDPLTGNCVFVDNSASCTDNNVCTENDYCVGGVCQPGLTPKVCDDNNPCT